MKIAILGDIHGNIEALKRAYTSALLNNIDRIYHLGDLGSSAPFVNEVVKKLRYICDVRECKSLGLKSPLEYLIEKGGMSQRYVTYTNN